MDRNVRVLCDMVLARGRMADATRHDYACDKLKLGHFSQLTTKTRKRKGLTSPEFLLEVVATATKVPGVDADRLTIAAAALEGEGNDVDDSLSSGIQRRNSSSTLEDALDREWTEAVRQPVHPNDSSGAAMSFQRPTVGREG